MNAMLLLVAILFALIAVAGYQLVTLNQTFNISATIQQNQSRVQIVTSAVRTALTVIDGKVAVPVPPTLVAEIPEVSPFRTAANGNAYVYCPVLPTEASGSANIVNERGDERYAVDTAQRNGITYAVAGRPGGKDDAKITALGIVAYVLTSQPNNPSPLRCADVTVADDGSTLLVQGGSVAPVYDNPVVADGASFVVSPDGSRPAQADTSDRVARSVADVVEYVKHYDVSDVRIRVFGDETFKASELASLFANSFGRTVRIQGPDSLRAVVKIEEDANEQGGLIEFVSPGQEIISNVALKGASGSDIALASAPGGSVTLQGASVGRVRTNGGDIFVSGASRVVPSTSALALALPVLADGGRVTFDVTDDSAAPAILSQTAAAVFASTGGDISIKSQIHAVVGSAASLFRTESGGKLRTSSGDDQIMVDRGSGFTAEQYNDLQRVSESCADGSASCTAICPSSKRVAWGECGSDNGAALAGFAADATASQYTCQWSTMTVAISPKAAVVCQDR